MVWVFNTAFRRAQHGFRCKWQKSIWKTIYCTKQPSEWSEFWPMPTNLQYQNCILHISKTWEWEFYLCKQEPHRYLFSSSCLRFQIRGLKFPHYQNGELACFVNKLNVGSPCANTNILQHFKAKILAILTISTFLVPPLLSRCYFETGVGRLTLWSI